MAAGNAASNLPPVLQNRGVQIGIVAFVLLLIIGGILLAVNSGKSMGELKTLLKGIDQSRALEIAAKLRNSAIDTEIVPTETGGVEIQVHEKQYDLAVLEMAKSDLLYTDDFKLFDKTDWAASDYEKRVKYMRAIGGELSRMVSRMSGIRWAKVHVTIPAEKVFASRYTKEKTSASVTLETEAGHSLSHTQVDSILSLVSGYVPEISVNQISIIDTKGRLYSSATDTSDDFGMGTGGSGGIVQKTQILSDSIGGRVQDYLDGVFGSGNSKAVVSVRLMAQKMTKNTTNFSPGAIGTQEYSEEALGDAAANSPYRGSDGYVTTYQEEKTTEQAERYQSQGEEMIDTRLKKDMPANGERRQNYQTNDSTLNIPAQSQDGQTSNQNYSGQNYAGDQGQFTDNAFQDPTTTTSKKPGKDKRDASIMPSPSDGTSGLYSMNRNGMNQDNNFPAPKPRITNSTAPQMGGDQTRYTCADGDEACKRNYRQHNFTIQSYPSYEQTVVESAPGALRSIKVSVVVQGPLPVPLDQLKASIAAAADPQMSSNDVEIIIKGNIKNAEEEKPSGFWGLNKKAKEGEPSFQWWWIPLILIGLVLALILVIGLINGLVGLFMPKKTASNKGFSNSEQNSNNGQTNPLDRVNLNNNRNVRFNSPPQNTQPNVQTNNASAQTYERSDQEEFNLNQANSMFDDEYEQPNASEENNMNQSRNNASKDLPFDLEDEFSLGTNESRQEERQQGLASEKINDFDSQYDAGLDTQLNTESNNQNVIPSQRTTQQPNITQSSNKRKPAISVEYD
jgi:flagellar biosynthesis/type III secretory pathway M-ring protein FliF/YscJ